MTSLGSLGLPRQELPRQTSTYRMKNSASEPAMHNALTKEMVLDGRRVTLQQALMEKPSDLYMQVIANSFDVRGSTAERERKKADPAAGWAASMAAGVAAASAPAATDDDTEKSSRPEAPAPLRRDASVLRKEKSTLAESGYLSRQHTPVKATRPHHLVSLLVALHEAAALEVARPIVRPNCSEIRLKNARCLQPSDSSLVAIAACCALPTNRPSITHPIVQPARPTCSSHLLVLPIFLARRRKINVFPRSIVLSIRSVPTYHFYRDLPGIDLPRPTPTELALGAEGAYVGRG